MVPLGVPRERRNQEETKCSKFPANSQGSALTTGQPSPGFAHSPLLPLLPCQPSCDLIFSGFYRDSHQRLSPLIAGLNLWVLTPVGGSSSPFAGVTYEISRISNIYIMIIIICIINVSSSYTIHQMISVAKL